ncbi:gamma-interferon-inducible lysosomal thiol reductase-like [Corticium candelabrum]|uniref:gamma-interferon-inducible lysosomal thiol reductase-like n=1 Tax=Corticium candelabrum TaxID=121492 RepID=UPI002E2726D5|nr:gamma-interferon-inducible lysosomal thiol reductase-like [Corticium candelabrum]
MLVVLVVAALTVGASSSNLVNVSFYSEALCPFCDQLTEGEMNEAVQKVGEIFTLHFVPWGNALMNPDGSFDCQHGEMECAMNTVEACVIKYYPSRSMWWPFIVCLEAHRSLQTWEIAQQCAEKQNITWTDIKTCAKGPMGKRLEVMYYEETASLNPPHQYTPWVLINGKHVKETHIIRKICAAYEGGNKPEACMHAQPPFPPIGGCYKEPLE